MEKEDPTERSGFLPFLHQQRKLEDAPLSHYEFRKRNSVLWLWRSLQGDENSSSFQVWLRGDDAHFFSRAEGCLRLMWLLLFQESVPLFVKGAPTFVTSILGPPSHRLCPSPICPRSFCQSWKRKQKSPRRFGAGG